MANNGYNIRAMVSAAVGLVLAGCAGSEQFKNGKSLLEVGSCKQAVVQLIESVELSLPEKETRSALLLAQAYRQDGQLPGNKSLNEKVRTLNQALVCAVESNLAAAGEAESAAQLDKAYLLAQEVLGWMPENEYAGLIMKRIEQNMAQAKELISQVQVASDANRWDEAMTLAEKAYQLNRTVTGNEDIRVKIRQGSYKWYYQAAQEALEVDKRAEALENLNKARSFLTMPASDDIIQITVENRNKADELAGQAEQAVQAGEYKQALASYQAAQKLYEQRSGLAQAIANTSEKLCQQVMEKARQKYAQGDYIQAMQLVQECQSVSPAYQGSDELLASIRNGLYLKHVGLAQDSFDNGLMGNAWWHGRVALGYQNDNEAAKLVNQAQEQIKQRVGFKVGVVRHADSNPTEGQIDDLVYSAVQKNSAELAQVKKVARYDTQGEFEVLVEWRLLNNDVDENTNSRYETTEFNNGKINVDNPEYQKVRMEAEQAERDYDDAQRQYERARDRWDREQDAMSGMTEEEKKEYAKTHSLLKKSKLDDYKNQMESEKRDRDSTRDKYQRTSPTIEKDDIQKWQYQVHSVSKKAEVEISMTVRDLRNNKILGEGRLLGQDSASDEYCIGDTFHNVKEDKLSLPSDNQMERNAVDKLSWKINELAATANRKYKEQYLDKMKTAREQNQQKQAIEEGINHYFINNVRFASEVTDMLNEILAEESQLSKWQDTPNK